MTCIPLSFSHVGVSVMVEFRVCTGTNHANQSTRTCVCKQTAAHRHERTYLVVAKRCFFLPQPRLDLLAVRASLQLEFLRDGSHRVLELHAREHADT